MLIRAAALVGLLALSSPVAADDKKDDPKSDEKLLVGTWKLLKTSQGDLPDGAAFRFEILKDGTFKLTATTNDEKDVNTGTWKLDNKKLAITFAEGSRKGTKQTDMVKELTEKKLILQETNGITEDWERVPEKKADK